jgi:hypothetical protein
MFVVDAIASLDERQQRLFACDCAEHVLHLFEQEYPEDKRPRKAIEISRQFAQGQATLDQLKEAGKAAKRAADDALGLSGISISRNVAANVARSTGWAAWDIAGKMHFNPGGWVDMTQFDAAFAACSDAYRAVGIALLITKGDVKEEAYDNFSQYLKARSQAIWTESAAERKWQIERAQWYIDSGEILVE